MNVILYLFRLALTCYSFTTEDLNLRRCGFINTQRNVFAAIERMVCYFCVPGPSLALKLAANKPKLSIPFDSTHLPSLIRYSRISARNSPPSQSPLCDHCKLPTSLAI
jgi:hypothetical protein